jgi:hypothetical protein
MTPVVVLLRFPPPPPFFLFLHGQLSYTAQIFAACSPVNVSLTDDGDTSVFEVSDYTNTYTCASVPNNDSNPYSPANKVCVFGREYYGNISNQIAIRNIKIQVKIMV